MKAVRKKLISQSGASITFALLLFLVCAVISSVVIVAGSTAAGRMARVAQMDQRYYAVTSAVELLKDAIDGRTVTVAYNKNDKKATAVSDGTGGAILNHASEQLIEAMKAGDASPSTVFSRQLALTAGANAGLNCVVMEHMSRNGLLVFTIYNGTSATEPKEKYALEITFRPTVKAAASDAADANETATVEWRFLSVHKLRQITAVGEGES